MRGQQWRRESEMSDREDNPKGLMNEVLPAPRSDEEGGSGAKGSGALIASPRSRTAAHLRKLLAGATGIAFQLQAATGFGDTALPGGKGDKSKDGKKPV